MENCSVILFHYDGNVDGWVDLSWNNKAIHIVAQNQTKWYIILQTPFKKFIFLNPNSKIYDANFFLRWFAKRFLHPDVVSMYDHIFLWDEDLGVDNFNPKRYYLDSCFWFYFWKILLLLTNMFQVLRDNAIWRSWNFTTGTWPKQINWHTPPDNSTKSKEKSS